MIDERDPPCVEVRLRGETWAEGSYELEVNRAGTASAVYSCNLGLYRLGPAPVGAAGAPGDDAESFLYAQGHSCSNRHDNSLDFSFDGGLVVSFAALPVDGTLTLTLAYEGEMTFEAEFVAPAECASEPVELLNELNG